MTLEQYRYIRKLEQNLTGKERLFFELYDRGYTQDEIGKRFSMTSQGVSKAIKIAEDKMIKLING